MADDYRNRSRYASDENWDQNQERNYRQPDYDQSNYGNANYDRETDWRNMNRNREANYGSSSYGNTGSRDYGSGGYGRNWEDDYNQGMNRNYGNYSGSSGTGYSGNRYGRREDWGRANVGTGIGSYSSDYGRNYDTDYRSNYGRSSGSQYGNTDYDDRQNMGNRDNDDWRRRSSGARNMYGGDTSNYGNMNQGGYDRGWWDRTRDEVSSWFGDEDAERRRSMDRRMNAGYRGKGPKDYHRSEDRIREDVCDRLTDDDMLDATNIHVEIKGDEVVLSGTVNSREQKRRAEDLVESISGVRDVENRIRIDRGDESMPGIRNKTTGSETSGIERSRNK